MRSVSSTNVRAVTVGLVTLVFVFVGGAVVLNLTINHPTDSPALWIALAPIFAALMWLLPGFMTGFMAKKLPLRHGLWLGVGSVGVVLACLSVVESLLRFSDTMPLSMFVGFLVPIFGGAVLGVFIGTYFAKRRDAP